jgi:hypothetical protein
VIGVTDGVADERPVQAPTKYDLTINLKNSEGTRTHRAADPYRACRRGDLIKGYLAAIAQSRLWHGAANHVLIGDGRFWGEADMPRAAMLPGGVKINERMG